ncbi:glycosyltransferase [Synechococcus sp. CBW1002]|uniref:glycosyltransferase n=1 Tax=Synechococcus sp. CBW1002 TaxID=1353134 RepID=UPI0018CEF942|nr:glycosyltransferase [Synechococcus sp. CBW1002]QPN60974.1 glycosyltransferase [Synechococcus sp. CBW1002]
MSPPESPSLILLVGMHRSGTSLLGSLLPALGVPLPGDLIAGDAHNPEGYYERSDITALQEQLLIAMGQWWPSEAGVLHRPEGWLDFPAVRSAAESLDRLLAQEQRRQLGPWAIKDPRTCLLLPLWRQVAAQRGVPLKLVLSVRDPAEVMVSLLQRDRRAAGMTAWRAQRLWWRHNRALLLDAADLPLLVVDYGAWFDPSTCRRQLQALGLFCLEAEPMSAALEAAAACIRPGHRRSRRSRAELPQALHPRLRRLHRALQELAAGPPDRERRQRRLVRWLAAPGRQQIPPIAPAGRSLRSQLIHRRASLAPQAEVGPWFDPAHYRRQAPGLGLDHDPLCHYWWRGWREQRSPHPAFEGDAYRLACRNRGLTVRGAPLRHFLTVGLAAGIPPSPVAEPRWLAGTLQRQALWRAARLEGLHPWGAAALALEGDDLQQAVERLRHWQRQGFSADDLAAIAAAPPGSFTLPAALLPDPPPLPQRCRLQVLGTHLHDWQVHAWLQHAPLPPGFSLIEGQAPPEAAESVIALVLSPLPPGPASLQLLGLALLPWVFARAEQVPLLRRLGINAQPLEPGVAPNGWLAVEEAEAEAARQLGVPPAAALAGLAPILAFGSLGAEWERSLAPPIWGWPEFDDLAIETPQQARLLAAWLDACNRAGIQLVRLEPPGSERLLRGWQALMPPSDPAPGWLPPQGFVAPLSAMELQGELRWRGQGAPAPPPVQTPRPAHTLLWAWQGDASGPGGMVQTPTAAVCISLHNYADRITAALESVLVQSHGPLELIVVDDASEDGGEQRCLAWLERHGQRFVRALLVRHTGNGGLAAARNTAFRLAQAPWCFVLDADNLLHPEAVAACLRLAQASPADIAVVHPLVEVLQDGVLQGSDSTGAAPSLISGRSWQRCHFLDRNLLDAMALVRRSAWDAVGGYAHIPGGWEDYDFWCKLMEAGYQGVLAPQRLATYHRHPESMLATATHQRLRLVSRHLQQRHPWLQLSLAAGPEEGWTLA